MPAITSRRPAGRGRLAGAPGRRGAGTGRPGPVPLPSGGWPDRRRMPNAGGSCRPARSRACLERSPQCTPAAQSVLASKSCPPARAARCSSPAITATTSAVSASTMPAQASRSPAAHPGRRRSGSRPRRTPRRRAWRASSSATVAGNHPAHERPGQQRHQAEREDRPGLGRRHRLRVHRMAGGRGRPRGASPVHLRRRRQGGRAMRRRDRPARPPCVKRTLSGTTRSRSRPAAQPARWPARSRSRSPGTRSSSTPWPWPPRSARPGCCGTC